MITSFNIFRNFLHFEYHRDYKVDFDQDASAVYKYSVVFYREEGYTTNKYLAIYIITPWRVYPP